MKTDFDLEVEAAGPVEERHRKMKRALRWYYCVRIARAKSVTEKIEWAMKAVELL